MQLWQLLCSFLQIGLLSIGGGYAAIPLIGEQTVRLHAWLTAAEFGDLVTIAEMTPGPIAVNAASFVGMRLGGPFGAVLATVGCILPGCALSLALAALYRCRPDAPLVRTVLATLRPVTAGLIGAAALGVLRTALGWPAVGAALAAGRLVLVAAALAALRSKKLGPIQTIAAAAAVWTAADWLLAA